ncbi:cation transporter [Xinfangfangia sp. CPCC 101601]|uniref:Cation transporter n=1 Tax=Pseudogemmobacter lacusdianii TaxID=3069608 RepID=A0ABU0W0U2_9RHOB|nr:cation transporter [Xinfangfangia sp. CPCC 101601]MDQ2067378.1 cation transporter [Xinfangfangia sp. CPCC 101601]
MAATFFNLSDEKGVLRLSVAVTVLVALLGIGFGLISGSFAIIFDGVYSLTDASMSLLSLLVVNLITNFATATNLSPKLRARFSMGFWHLEPMVLLLNGTLLIGVAVYALITSVGSLLQGGRELEFGWAIAYAAATVALCITIAVAETRANRRIKSDFLALDVKGWIMSSSITAALLIAFCIGYLLQGTRHEWLQPYIDPAVLALVCLLIIPLPIATIRQALSDVLLAAPPAMRSEIDEIASRFAAKHGFLSYRAYVARVGRARQIELYFIVPPEMPPRPITAWDALRDEIGTEIGGDSAHRWLTVVFTGDPEWAE